MLDHPGSFLVSPTPVQFSREATHLSTSRGHCWAPVPAAGVPAGFLVIPPRCHQLSFPDVDAGADVSLLGFALTSAAVGAFRGLFFFFKKHCALVLFGPSRGEPGIPGQAASSAAMRVCLPGLWDGQHYLGLLPSCCSCHTWRRKGTLQASNACLSGLPFPLRTSSVECRAGLVPMASSMTGAAGGYFCSGGVRGTKVQLPGAVLHVGLCRGSQVRAGCVSFKEWELSWCQPSPHTFSKSLPPSLPFQPLSFRPRGHGSGLPHFSPACCSNSSWHLIHPHPILCGLGTDPLFSI